MENIGSIFTNHPIGIGVALAALIVWTLGNYLKKKIMVYIGIGLTVLAVVLLSGLLGTIG